MQQCSLLVCWSYICKLQERETVNGWREFREFSWFQLILNGFCGLVTYLAQWIQPESECIASFLTVHVIAESQYQLQKIVKDIDNSCTSRWTFTHAEYTWPWLHVACNLETGMPQETHLENSCQASAVQNGLRRIKHWFYLLQPRTDAWTFTFFAIWRSHSFTQNRERPPDP